MSWIDVSGDVL